MKEGDIITSATWLLPVSRNDLEYASLPIKTGWTGRLRYISTGGRKDVAAFFMKVIIPSRILTGSIPEVESIRLRCTGRLNHISSTL
jgi:hypothetical protein